MPLGSRLPLEIAGTCSGVAAAKFNARRQLQGIDSVRQQKVARIVAVREVIDVNWPKISKHLKTLEGQHNGCAPFEDVCCLIMHCTALQPVDEPAVATIVRKCIINKEVRDPRIGGRDFAVDTKRLWQETVGVEKQRRPADWELRFRADGVIKPEAIQKTTTGVEKNARSFAKAYRGAPYAVTSDAACVEEMTARYQQEAQDRMRRELMRKAKFVEFRDPHHPNHPEHNSLHVAEYQQGTTASSSRVKSPRKRRVYNLPEGGEWLLTTDACRDALLGLPNGHLGEREVFEMIWAVDPKLRGYIRVDDIMARFSFELLKPKASRNTLGRHNNDGFGTALEWRAAQAPALGLTRQAEHMARMQRGRASRRHHRLAEANKQPAVQLQQVSGPESEASHAATAASVVPRPPPVHASVSGTKVMASPRGDVAAILKHTATGSARKPAPPPRAASREYVPGAPRKIHSTLSKALVARADPVKLGNQPASATPRPATARGAADDVGAPEATAVAQGSTPRQRPASAR